MVEQVYDELRMCQTCIHKITYHNEQSCTELAGANHEVAMHHVVRRCPHCPLWAKGEGIVLDGHELQQGL